MPRPVAICSASSSARWVEPATAQPQPRKSAPAAVTVWSGCRPKACSARAGASAVSGEAPLVWPTKRAAPRTACAAAEISASGTHSNTTSVPAGGASPRPRGLPAPRAAASAVPSRPRPTTESPAGTGSEVGEGGEFRSSSRMRDTGGRMGAWCGGPRPPPATRSAPRLPGNGLLRHDSATHGRTGARPRRGVRFRAVGRPAEERRADLVELYRELHDQHGCPLAGSRTHVVFGMGNADADLMFVGEAPGATEDQQGKPFVGRAGQLLDMLLGEIGLSRGEVFIANILKCLRYNAQVQLGDGSWERIGRLVRSRYDGDVMSVDSEGRLVARRVIGWHATPVAGRSIYRLTYRSAKNAGAGRVGIELTGDHPVLTERGWVAVDELGQGDRIATGQGLSDVALDVAQGSLLGDGHLSSAS